MSTPILAQDICTTIDKLMVNAPSNFTEYKGEKIDNHKSKSKLELHGAQKCNIEEHQGKHVFKAYFEESNDRDVLLEQYDKVSTEIKACLSKKYAIEEKLEDDGIGKIMVITQKKGKDNGVRIYLEFSKATMADASYSLRLTAHQEIQ